MPEESADRLIYRLLLIAAALPIRNTSGRNSSASIPRPIISPRASLCSLARRRDAVFAHSSALLRRCFPPRFFPTEGQTPVRRVSFDKNEEFIRAWYRENRRKLRRLLRRQLLWEKWKIASDRERVVYFSTDLWSYK